MEILGIILSIIGLPGSILAIQQYFSAKKSKNSQLDSRKREIDFRRSTLASNVQAIYTGLTSGTALHDMPYSFAQIMFANETGYKHSEKGRKLLIDYIGSYCRVQEGDTSETRNSLHVASNEIIRNIDEFWSVQNEF